jgi:hypothetical protein
VTVDVPLAAGDFAGYVGVGDGRRLYLECHGQGSPTVILEAGLRSRSDFWSERTEETPSETVFAGVARFTRVCAYDRPGTTLGIDQFSRSDPVPMPRTARDAVADLRALIRNGPITGPLVLNTGPLPGLEGYADLEQILFRPSFDEMTRIARRHPLPSAPLIVISRGVEFPLPEGLPAGLTTEVVERAWRRSQRALARLLPDARHEIAERSQHYVMFSQPHLITRSPRRLVDRARERGAPPLSATSRPPAARRG